MGATQAMNEPTDNNAVQDANDKHIAAIHAWHQAGAVWLAYANKKNPRASRALYLAARYSAAKDLVNLTTDCWLATKPDPSQIEATLQLLDAMQAEHRKHV